MKPSIKAIIKDLKKVGYEIVFEGDKYRSKKSFGTGIYGGPIYYTKRELYNLHKEMYRNRVHPDIKKFSNGKDRAATRNKLNNKDFDGIPPNKRVKVEDPWSWD